MIPSCLYHPQDHLQTWDPWDPWPCERREDSGAAPGKAWEESANIVEYVPMEYYTNVIYTCLYIYIVPI